MAQNPGGGGVTLYSIAITTAPTRTAYTVGDSFDPEGMVVTATLSDDTTVVISHTDLSFTPSLTTALATTHTSVAVSYTRAGVTRTANQAITVTEPGPLPAGAITTVEEFNAIFYDAESLAGNYFLANDIDFEGADTYWRTGWQESVVFSGIFDGRGFAIRNFNVTSDFAPVGSHAGLFPRITGLVRNVALLGFTTVSTPAGQSGVLTPQLNGTVENILLRGTAGFVNYGWSGWGANGILAGHVANAGSASIRNVVIDVNRTTTAGGALGAYYVPAFLSNYFNTAAHNNTTNVFAIQHDARAQYIARSGAWAGTAVEFPSDANVVRYAAADLGGIDFSALSNDYWVLTAGQMPQLKNIGVPTILTVTDDTTGTGFTISAPTQIFAGLDLSFTVAVEIGYEVLDAITVTVEGIAEPLTTVSTESPFTFVIPSVASDVVIEQVNGVTALPAADFSALPTAYWNTSGEFPALNSGHTSADISGWTAISTPQEFLDMTMDGNYYLENDLDFDGVEFYMIFGNESTRNAYAGGFGDMLTHAFTGNFDGQGYTLDNITIDLPATNGWGFGVFRIINNATIRNVSVTNLTMLTFNGEHAGQGGGFIGATRGESLVENVYVQGEMHDRGTGAGAWQRSGAFAGNIGGTTIFRNVIVETENIGARDIYSFTHNWDGAATLARTFENIWVFTANPALFQTPPSGLTQTNVNTYPPRN